MGEEGHQYYKWPCSYYASPFVFVFVLFPFFFFFYQEYGYEVGILKAEQSVIHSECSLHTHNYIHMHTHRQAHKQTQAQTDRQPQLK